MLEKKLQEELNRYKAINKYGKTMIMEQDAPAAPEVDPLGDEAAPTDAPMDAPTDVPPPPMDAPMDDATTAPDMDATEEIDITDLVNMTKSLKKDIEDHKNDNTGVVNKMDDVFSKLNDLEQKLSQMDAVMAKIDDLGNKVATMKEPTAVEKLEMRSLDSYPFNEKPGEFFSHKQQEMQASGKNEYVLTKDEVDNYSPDEIKTSFNPEQEEDEFKY